MTLSSNGAICHRQIYTDIVLKDRFIVLKYKNILKRQYLGQVYIGFFVFAYFRIVVPIDKALLRSFSEFVRFPYRMHCANV
jgi:hypothetical protein